MDPTRKLPPRIMLCMHEPVRWVDDEDVDALLRADLAASARAVVRGIDFAALEAELLARLARPLGENECG
jgi:hypothetical protein